MENSINILQTDLARDLATFETANLTEEQLKIIEDTYKEVYLTLHNINKEE